MSELRHIALGIVLKDGETLLVKRREVEHGLNNEMLTWVFPGGKVEKNETVFNSVVREVFEETGYKVKAVSTLDESKHPTFPVYVSYVACELVDDNANKVEDKEIAEIQWLPVSDFQNVITSSLNIKVKEYLKI